MSFLGTQTLSGNGEIIFTAAGSYENNVIYIQGDGGSNPATLTIGSGITIHGTAGGTVAGYYGNDTLINQGTITNANISLSSLNNQGSITLTGNRTCDVLNLQIEGSGFLSGQPQSNYKIAGNLLGNSQNADHFEPSGNMLFDGNGTVNSPQLIEAMSNDLGTAEIVNTVCTAVDVWGLNIYRGANFGLLFTEWASITSKPMFLSEFGADSYFLTSWYPVVGYEDETAQQNYMNSQWQDIVPELSALDSMRACLGGAVFEWVDEWWKVLAQDGGSPAMQDNGGFDTYWNSNAQPDGFANEEYFGIVKIDRTPKEAYTLLQQAFQATNLLGDLNGDNVIDLADAVIALQVLANVQPPDLRPDYVESGSDVNGDGKIGLAEAVYALRMTAGLIAQKP